MCIYLRLFIIFKTKYGMSFNIRLFVIKVCLLSLGFLSCNIFCLWAQNQDFFKIIINDKIKLPPPKMDDLPMRIDQYKESKTDQQIYLDLKNKDYLNLNKFDDANLKIAPALLEAIKNPDLGIYKFYYLEQFYIEGRWYPKLTPHLLGVRKNGGKPIKSKKMREITEIFYPSD
ncbi:hypothetical protein AwDysgo_05200 [Bacteroidales bacterium]|nr:hypothetical protein AwDysgo_05200 [Bacteroidales bacterium]